MCNRSVSAQEHVYGRLNGRCTTYYIGSGPERMFMLLRVLSRFKTVTDNAARVSSTWSPPRVHRRPEGWRVTGHCPSRRRNSHSGSAPQTRTSPQTRNFGRSEGFVPEIESWRCGIAKLLRGRANRRSTVPKEWTASATRQQNPPRARSYPPRARDMVQTTRVVPPPLPMHRVATAAASSSTLS